MTVELWLAYTTTLLVFMASPGPSHMLMLSNSLVNGYRPALATAAGDLSANVAQMFIVAVGLASVVLASEQVFLWIKWAGVVYLVVMGIATFRKPNGPISTVKASTRRVLFLQGFVTSASNPKAIVFFAALFPQFINTSAPTTHQFLILGATFLVVDGAFLVSYGKFASWIAGRFDRHVSRLANRISGALLIFAAFLLGLREVRTT